MRYVVLLDDSLVNIFADINLVSKCFISLESTNTFSIICEDFILICLASCKANLSGSSSVKVGIFDLIKFIILHFTKARKDGIPAAIRTR